MGEIKKDVPNAEEVGLAYLPGYRLSFDKHSQKWGGDAANIQEDWSATKWGYVYRVDNEGLECLKGREVGYRIIDVKPLVLDSSIDRVTPVPAVTFAANSICPENCGPNKAYVELVARGANERGAPSSYLEWIGSMDPSDTESQG
jgi:hypothetical protein